MVDDFNDDDVQPDTPKFPEALQVLREQKEDGSIVNLSYGLSGLGDEQIEELRPVWEQVKPPYRRKTMRMLAEIGETDFSMDYSAIGLFGLDDSDPGVRQAAIDVLWIDTSLPLMNKLIDLGLNDESLEVRAAACSALGRFILAGEFEELPMESAVLAQEAVIKIWNDSDVDISVRRRALEAISHCSNKIIPDAITEAYNSGDQPLRVSAVFAMGCSYNEKRWGKIVLEELDSDDAEIRYEAARSAGLLEIAEAVPNLGKMIIEEDREIVNVAVWSLGEIGSKEAVRLLGLLSEKAEEDGDDDLMELVDDAIGNATIMAGFLGQLDDSDDDLEDMI